MDVEEGLESDLNKEEEEGLEDWNADFLDELFQKVQKEEEAHSCQSSSNPNPLATDTHSPLFQQNHHQTRVSSSISYSPPRELSQRPIHVVNNKSVPSFPNPGVFSPPHDDAKDQEIERLKKELGRVSKKLTNLEQECCELRNERNRKEEQLKFAYSDTAEKDTSDHCLKNKKLKCDPAQNNHVVPQQLINAKATKSQIGYKTCLASSSKAIGIQTDETGESRIPELNSDISSQSNVSNQLLGIWSPSNAQKSGRYLLSKLLTACPTDFHFLFGCMSINSVLGASAVGEGSCNAPLQYHLSSFQSSEAAKISHLYSVLTQIGNGFLPMESLLGPFIELCKLENVDILCCSLSILHIFVKHLFNSGRKLEERDSVKIEGATSGIVYKGRSLFSVGEEEVSCEGYSLFGTMSSSDPQILSKKGVWNLDNWVSIFNFLCCTAVKRTEERARLVAVSTMNVVLLNTNAYNERERFGQAPIFESIAQLLTKDARSRVQKEALHLLYLLLNCPKLLNVFCSGCKDGDTAEKNASTSKTFSLVLEGLASCIGSCGNSIKDIELHKKAITTLAYLASSGKSGFEILVNHKLPGGRSFLMLILQMLISEMDVEASVSSEPAESFKARTLLMREALILLNRIVSNPGYSAIVLRLLTGSRDMVSMTMDIVSRLSRKDQIPMPSDSITRKTRESEVVDLARVLKKRIFVYLGDKIT